MQLPDVGQDDWNTFTADNFSQAANQRIDALGFTTATNARIADLNNLYAPPPTSEPNASPEQTAGSGADTSSSASSPSPVVAPTPPAPALPAPDAPVTAPLVPPSSSVTPTSPVTAPLVAPSASASDQSSGQPDYISMALNAASAANIDPRLFVEQIRQESNFNPNARSPAGATGIAQFMPNTAAGLGVNPNDPQAALSGAAQYMRTLIDGNGGDVTKALAAYNAGQGSVDQYGGIPPFKETQKYVSDIMGRVASEASTGDQGQYVPGPTEALGRTGTEIQSAYLKTPPAGDISQFGDPQLTSDEAYAACGPAAAVRFADRYGRNPTLKEAVDLARSVGWTPQQGMAGLGSEKALMDKLQVPTKLVNGPQWDTFAQEAQTGNPVTISTQGHYFFADGFNPTTGAFHVGRSGLDLKGGAEWMTPDQMTNLMGPVQGGLLADNPTVPTPSTADQTTDPAAWLGRQKDALSSSIGNGVSAVQGWASGLGTAADAILSPPAGQPAGSQPMPSDALTDPLGTGNAAGATQPPAAPAGPLDAVKQKFSDALDALGGLFGGAGPNGPGPNPLDIPALQPINQRVLQRAGEGGLNPGDVLQGETDLARAGAAAIYAANPGLQAAGAATGSNFVPNATTVSGTRPLGQMVMPDDATLRQTAARFGVDPNALRQQVQTFNQANPSVAEQVATAGVQGYLGAAGGALAASGNPLAFVVDPQGQLTPLGAFRRTPAGDVIDHSGALGSLGDETQLAIPETGGAVIRPGAPALPPPSPVSGQFGPPDNLRPAVPMPGTVPEPWDTVGVTTGEPLTPATQGQGFPSAGDFVQAPGESASPWQAPPPRVSRVSAQPTPETPVAVFDQNRQPLGFVSADAQTAAPASALSENSQRNLDVLASGAPQYRRDPGNVITPILPAPEQSASDLLQAFINEAKQRPNIPASVVSDMQGQLDNLYGPSELSAGLTPQQVGRALQPVGSAVRTAFNPASAAPQPIQDALDLYDGTIRQAQSVVQRQVLTGALTTDQGAQVVGQMQGVATRQFLSDVGASPDGVLAKTAGASSTRPPANWVNGGSVTSALQNYWLDPQTATVVRNTLNTRVTVPGLEGLARINGAVKQLGLTGSPFHFVQEQLQAVRLGISQGKVPGTGVMFGRATLNSVNPSAFRSWLTTPAIASIADRAAAAGATLGASAGEGIDLSKGITPMLIRGAAGGAIGGVGTYATDQARGVNQQDSMKDALIAAGVGAVAAGPVAAVVGPAIFERQIPTLKILGFKMLTDGGMADKDAATMVNNTFGGQNLTRMARDPNLQALMRSVVLAPDWWESWARNIGSAIAGMPVSAAVGTAARKNVASTVIGAGVTLEGLNYLMTGHFTNGNAAGHELDLEIPQSKIPGAPQGGDLVHVDVLGPLKPMAQLVTSGGDVGAFARSRLSPAAGLAVAGLQNKNAATGGQIVQPGTPPLMAGAQLGAYEVQQAVPVGAQGPMQGAKVAGPIGGAVSGLGLRTSATNAVAISHPAQVEIDRLNKAGYTGLSLPYPDRTFMQGNSEIVLSVDERRHLAGLRSQSVANDIQPFISNPNYNKMSDDQKAYQLGKIISRADDHAKQQFLNELTPQDRTARMRAGEQVRGKKTTPPVSTGPLPPVDLGSYLGRYVPAASGR